MKVSLTCVLGAFAFSVAVAEPVKEQNLSKRDVIILKHSGGMVKVPNSQKGQIVVVDASNGAPAASIDAAMKQISDSTRVEISKKVGKFSFPAPKLDGSATLFVVDDAAYPMSLVAPESKWALVNVAPLKSDKPQFYDARIRKEMVRTLVLLMGAANSSYPGALTGCVVSADDLDKFADTVLPVDVEDRIEPYIKGYGIVPATYVTYRNACVQGWAGKPENEFQQKVWNEIHELPSKPITIDPEKRPVKK